MGVHVTDSISTQKWDLRAHAIGPLRTATSVPPDLSPSPLAKRQALVRVRGDSSPPPTFFSPVDGSKLQRGPVRAGLVPADAMSGWRLAIGPLIHRSRFRAAAGGGRKQSERQVGMERRLLPGVRCLGVRRRLGARPASLARRGLDAGHSFAFLCVNKRIVHRHSGLKKGTACCVWFDRTQVKWLGPESKRNLWSQFFRRKTLLKYVL